MAMSKETFELMIKALDKDGDGDVSSVRAHSSRPATFERISRVAFEEDLILHSRRHTLIARASFLLVAGGVQGLLA